MAYAHDSRANSPANDLRDALDQVERLVVSPSPDSVETLLTLLDKCSLMFQDLTQMGMDLRSEEGRWEGIRSRLETKSSEIVTAANQVGGFKMLRAKNPPAEESWWQLDQFVSQRRREATIKTVRFLVTTVGVLALLYFGIQTFFPPNPDAVFVLETEAAIETALTAEELDVAATTALDAAMTLPTEPELWVWSAVLSEQVGDEKQAAGSLEMAKELLADRPTALWIEMGNKRLQLGNFDGAEAAANEALALDENSAQATFLLGGIAEMRGDNRTAIEYFEKTFDLAQDTETELAVIARVRMGNLLQSLDPFDGETAPADGTPERATGD